MLVYPIEPFNPVLQKLLDQAIYEGEIQIRNKEGQLFLLKSLQENTSPLAVPCLNLGVSTQEIIDTVREIREFY